MSIYEYSSEPPSSSTVLTSSIKNQCNRTKEPQYSQTEDSQCIECTQGKYLCDSQDKTALAQSQELVESSQNLCIESDQSMESNQTYSIQSSQQDLCNQNEPQCIQCTQFQPDYSSPRTNASIPYPSQREPGICSIELLSALRKIEEPFDNQNLTSPTQFVSSQLKQIDFSSERRSSVVVQSPMSDPFATVENHAVGSTRIPCTQAVNETIDLTEGLPTDIQTIDSVASPFIQSPTVISNAEGSSTFNCIDLIPCTQMPKDCENSSFVFEDSSSEKSQQELPELKRTPKRLFIHRGVETSCSPLRKRKKIVPKQKNLFWCLSKNGTYKLATRTCSEDPPKMKFLSTRKEFPVQLHQFFPFNEKCIGLEVTHKQTPSVICSNVLPYNEIEIVPLMSTTTDIESIISTEDTETVSLDSIHLSKEQASTHQSIEKKIFSNYKFILTIGQNPSEYSKKSLCSLLYSHGASILSTNTFHTLISRNLPTNDIICISDTPKRTSKYLLSIAINIPRVKVNWILDSISNGFILSHSPLYLLPNDTNQRNIPIHLPELFSTLSFTFSPTLPLDHIVSWTRIIKVHGGIVSETESPTRKNIFVGEKRTPTSIDTDYLVWCIVNQSIDQ